MRTASRIGTLNVAPLRLWQAWFLEDEFRRGVDKVMRLDSTVVRISESGEGDSWRVQRIRTFDTDRDVPKVLLKLVRGVTRVEETTTLDMGERVMRTELVLPVIGSRVQYGYRYRWDVRAAEPGGTLDWKGRCDARIPLVKGLAEKWLMDQLEDATEEGAAFAREYLSNAT